MFSYWLCWLAFQTKGNSLESVTDHRETVIFHIENIIRNSECFIAHINTDRSSNKPLAQNLWKPFVVVCTSAASHLPLHMIVTNNAEYIYIQFFTEHEGRSNGIEIPLNAPKKFQSDINMFFFFIFVAICTQLWVSDSVRELMLDIPA